jgi:glucose-1-phosphate cytidylyltransferase
MANYTDALTDLPLPAYLDHFYRSNMIASLLTVKPSLTFHVVKTGTGNGVSSIEPVSQSDLWINGGFFVFKKEIFDYMREGEELVLEPFSRLIAENQLVAYPYEGFWVGMDTMKEKQQLDDLYQSGNMPWAVWESARQVPREGRLTQGRLNGNQNGNGHGRLVSYKRSGTKSRFGQINPL